MNIDKKTIGLLLGPLAFICILLFFHPKGLSAEANAILKLARSNNSAEGATLYIHFLLVRNAVN